MSQFFTGSTAGSLPPSVAELIGTDFDSSGNPPGLVTPSNHKFYILGTNGIVTHAEETDATNDTVQVGFAGGTTITSDGAGQTQTILTFSTSTNSAFIITALFIAYEPSTGNSFNGRLLVGCKNVLGVVSVVSELENISGGDPTLLSCSFTAVGSGAFLDLNVKGLAGHTIHWSVITPGVTGAN